jgi:poly(ADP-ribose) glycohydrolase ARH3
MNMTLEDHFVGSMLGLALGDAMGAPHEGGFVGRFAWWVLGIGQHDILRWTDDTQMAVVLAESLAEHGRVNADDLATRWAEQMEWRRGYGPGTRELLQRIQHGEPWQVASRAVFPDGSFGNGAAMRAAPIGLFFHDDPNALRAAAELASSITHAHPLGIEGGALIARATALALNLALASAREGKPPAFDPSTFLIQLADSCTHAEFHDRLRAARRVHTADDAASRLGHGVLAHQSAVTAILAFCRCPDDFLKLMEFVVAVGGDTDTIAAMAGGIFGAFNGPALPAEFLVRLEEHDRIESIARKLHQAWSNRVS